MWKELVAAHTPLPLRQKCVIATSEDGQTSIAVVCFGICIAFSVPLHFCL
jgi:hypothetical protein